MDQVHVEYNHDDLPVPGPLLTPAKLPTPILVDQLATYLEGYDEAKREYLLKGLREGFSIGSRGEVTNKEPRNLKSAYDNPDIVDKKLQLELDAGRMLGPFDSPPLENMVISPIGLHPKKSGDFRLITHMSHPKGSSVNDSIPDENATVQYASVLDAIAIIKRVGRGAYLAKTDIKSAFRIIQINPKDYRLQGLKWRGRYLVDITLIIGSRSSCQIFEAFSTAIEWIARHKLKITNITHILDDFFIACKNEKACNDQLNLFIKFCKKCGIPLAQDKTMGPAQVLPFAGIELDTDKMIARLPHDKITKSIDAITSTLKLTRVSLKSLQELCGLLNFCCTVVYPGRCFLRRLYNLSIGLTNKYATAFLNSEVRDDLQMWLEFLRGFNGKRFFMTDQWVSAAALNLYSDAAQSKGYGATLGREWFYGAWPEHLRDVDITTLEFYPIVVALNVWRRKLNNLNLNIHTDNEALVAIINSQTVKRNDLCLKLLRYFVLTCLKYNILVRAFHISGSKNVICDSLSRLQVDKFHEVAPAMHSDPLSIPPHLSPTKLLKI